LLYHTVKTTFTRNSDTFGAALIYNRSMDKPANEIPSTPLPTTLPTDPDLLEALYTLVVARGDYSQADFDRLMEARLRAWGIEPASLTVEQVLAAMQESMNRLLINLHGARRRASTDIQRARFEQLILIAEQIRGDIDAVTQTID
jgi:hypothetical protein